MHRTMPSPADPLRLRICHLYPDLMNLYGDRGNILTLTQRARWHGIRDVQVVPVTVGDEVDFADVDIVFIGGGQDREQGWIAEDMVRSKQEGLTRAVEEGLPLLAVCGGYQLLGRYYQTGDGKKLDGIGLFDAYTVAGNRRMIGNVVIRSPLGGEAGTIVGFENHSGRTYLGQGMEPLGRVVVGHGNNGRDGGEGVRYRNSIGTYLHGSLLPKNPALADWILQRALERRYGRFQWHPLDDALEWRAHAAAIRRAREVRGE